MNTESFVDILKEVVRNSSVKSVETTLEYVPGRSPDRRLVELSTWYHSLAERDKYFLRQVVAESVDSALFGFLCVLDGVRAVEPDGNSGDFEVRYHRNGDSIVLSPNEEAGYLHDLYNAE